MSAKTQSSTGKESGWANNPPEFAAGFDLFRLESAADALIAGPPLSRAERQELARIIENLTALKETEQ